jgi:branched-chain amino acid aminotransferase
MRIYINGKWVDKSKAVVSVFDHGFLYGDGVFEGIRSYNGLIFKLTEHVNRLYESAHTLMIKVPLTKAKLQEVVVKTLRINKLKNAYIRLILTRGEGDLGLDPRKCSKPSVIIIADKISLYPQSLYNKGLAIVTVATSRNVPEALNPQIKSLNYLNNILAKIEATTAGFEEALMLSSQGTVAECTGENVFIMKNGMLITPPAHVGILKGITRLVVMKIARDLGLPVKEEILSRHDLYNADEMFLTGTAAEIVPIVKVDNRVIGRGNPGKWTALLLKEFRRLTRQDGVRYEV